MSEPRILMTGIVFGEGGQVVQTVDTTLGCFSCALGGPDARTLYMVVADWSRGPAMVTGDPTGRILALDVAVPAPRPAR